MSSRWLKLLLFVSVWIPLSASVVLADTLTGEIRGQVLDTSSGVPLSGVRVFLTNEDRGRTREMTTDVAGRYLFLQLEPGRYTLYAERDGYYSITRRDILVRLNRLKVVVPPFQLRREVTTPTQQVTLQGEQTRTAVVDLSASGPAPRILAITDEPARIALLSHGEWGLRFNFERELLGALPLRGGRSFDQVALWLPGVFRVPQVSGFGPAVGRGVGSPGQFSVNGQRGRSNNFTADGSDNNDEDIGVRRQGFVSLVPQSVESVEEFQIMTAGHAAEFGRNSGAMVNAVTRSGGRRLHGQVVGLWEDDALVARDFFDIPFQKTANSDGTSGARHEGDRHRSTTLGATAGGTISADTLFWLGSVERREVSGLESAHFVVPHSEERGLRTRDGFVPIDQLEEFLDQRGIAYGSAAGRGIFSLYPLPNNPAGPFGDHTYSESRTLDGEGWNFSGKADWYLDSVHSLTGRYNFTDDDFQLPFTGDAIRSSLETATRTQNLSFYFNSSTPGWANALRISYGRTASGFSQAPGSPYLFGSEPEEGYLQTEQLKLPYGSFGPFGVTGPVGQLQLHPYSPIGVDVFNFPQGRTNNTYQISDFFTLIGREHTLKWGFDLRRVELHSFSDRNSRPMLLFTPGLISSSCLQNPGCLFATPDGFLSATDAAALGAPAATLQSLSTQNRPDSSLSLSFQQLDLFFQDEWQVSDTVTLQMGVRYERQSVPTERHRRIEESFGLHPEDFFHLEPEGSGRDQAIIRAGNEAFDRALLGWNEFLGGRTSIYQPDRDNWAPRAGLAWDPWGTHRTAVRAGYSLLYNATLGAVTSRSRSVFPTFVPVNLDLNFRPPDGNLINSPVFFEFAPLGEPLITPGTLNRYNLADSAFATALGTLFSQAPPFPGASLSSNGLAFTLPARSLPSAYSHHFFFSLEQQLPADHVVAIRYVATRGRHLTRFATPNAGLVATPVLFSSPALGGAAVLDIPPTLDSENVGRPDRSLGSYQVFENTARSEYHSFQLSLERALAGDLHYRFHWTWSHALDEVSDPYDGRGFYALPQNSLDPGLEWASANFDARHRFSGFLIWDLPWMRSGGGWRVAVTTEFQTGQPFTLNSAFDRNFDGNLTDRLDRLEGLLTDAGSAQPLRLAAGVKPSDLIAERGAAGRVQRNSHRADGLSLVDLAVSRRFVLGEDRAFILRGEVFNVFDATHFGIPVRILESPGFGAAFDTQTEGRSLRLYFRLDF